MMEAWQETLIGVIWMIVLGPAVGNYATSVVFRLPFGQTPFEKNPYCDNCGTMLQPKDLFPILSWLSTRGKCRYCHTPFRASYTFIEIACGIIFVTDYLLFGMSETFLMVTAIGVFLVILAGLAYHEGKLYKLIWTYVVGLCAVYRVLQEGSLYPMGGSMFTMLFVSILLWRAAVLVKRADDKQMPMFIWLAVMIGIAIPLASLWWVSLIALGIYLLMKGICRHENAIMAASIAVYSGLVLPV